jgi:exonuclease SbcD
MKFFHLSDLHLGKRVNEFSMLEDQRDILIKIVSLAKEHKPDAVFIAGDVYDKSMPMVEAVQLLDRFLVWLNELGITVFIVSGNHDSAERVAFGAELLKNSNVHIVQSYSGKMNPIPLTDGFGDINVWMLPYLKPSNVRRYFTDKDINSYSEAVAAALSNAPIDLKERNVLIAHQFVTGAVTSESEEIMVGGSENVNGALFDAFDYVALGHIHRPQNIGRPTLRYSGTPLMYSFSEANDTKSITVVEMGKKGDVDISELPLTPARAMREIRGTYNEIMTRDNYRNTNTEDYLRIVLTDEQDEPEAMAKLRNVYPNIMRVEYDNKRTRAASSIETVVSTDKKASAELLGEFFEMQNGKPMSDEQTKYTENLFAEIWEEVVTA